MSSKEYKLSANLYGHSADVRSIAISSNSDIVSGSRDKTAKFWKYNSLAHTYQECMTYRDQKNFVGSVLYLEPSEAFPDGLIITGGNDHVILIYKPSEPFATYTLKEHTNSVVCLSKGNEVNSFLSSSWDTTAKFWSISGGVKCTATFNGHSAAVWSVIQLADDRVVTASADKIIAIWNTNGENIAKLTGHTDCVRSLCDFPDLNIFLSVANDAAIKVWKYSGENVDTYYGHSSYIYSISRCIAGGANCFVTSDEDRTVRYWENGINIQTITLPAQSIWSVACLQNGDIVTGSSDGIIRIFTREQSRVAEEQVLTKFTEEVNAIKQQGLQEIGGVKVSDLPGREALYDPGKRPGQMKMIRESHGVVAYTWVEDGDNSHWDKIGDVMGGTEKTASEKTMYEGKAYDFVFSVDVEDGKPPLKLPYNRGDDVYQAAQAFMTKHFLPADYLEQIVDFILKNSKEQYVPPTNNEYQDPFTGGNRYTPAYSNNNQATGANIDPFTGGSAYTTNKIVSNASIVDGINKFFPVSKYHTFEIGDPRVILNKLKEFNKKLMDTNNSVNEEDLEEVIKICAGPPSNANVFDLLFKLLEWPDEFVFPVLDIVRMSVRQETNNEVIVSMNNGAIMDKIKSYLTDSCKFVNNTIVALRTICNLCIHEAGETLVYNHCLEILENVSSLKQLNKNSQVALASVLLNITIVNLKKNDETGYSVLAQLLPETVNKFTDSEAHLRAYVAIGTLLTSASSHKQELKAQINGNQNFLTTLQLHSMSTQGETEKKRNKCLQQLRTVL